jgi:hypothetical protein
METDSDREEGKTTDGSMVKKKRHPPKRMPQSMANNFSY